MQPSGRSAAETLAAAPLAYLAGHGSQADAIAPLTWALMIVSIVVVVVSCGMVLAGVLVRRVRTGAPESVPIAQGADGMNWIYIGLVPTGVLLAGALVWTMVVLATTYGPGRPAPLTIEVTGRQWWWQARYLGDDPAQAFSTANEIHIPVGQPVRIRLVGGDVIHSFWVPALGGKMDTIPGRANLTWIEAREPGVYRGQCGEFCGVQHAHMAFEVVAERPADFERWRAAQLAPASGLLTPETAAGLRTFTARCGRCHAVRGTQGRGASGPDLTHLMSRRTIASGMLVNNRGDLAGWISNPQALKPGTRMPTTYLSPAELADVRAYLETLK